MVKNSGRIIELINKQTILTVFYNTVHTVALLPVMYGVRPSYVRLIIVT